MTRIEIRDARPDDIAAIVAIWRESMALHAERDPTFTPRADGHSRFASYVGAQLRSPDAAVLVAEADGAVAAYGICLLRRRADLFEPDEHGLMTDLDVSAGHRRTGLGERLLEQMCDWLRSRGIERIEAEVVVANELAAGFWRKRGFTPYLQAMSRQL